MSDKMREALRALVEVADWTPVAGTSARANLMMAIFKAREALAEQPAQGVLDSMADRAWQRFEATLAQPEPVAWGMPNTAITGKKMALMMVRLDIPSNDQYGGSMWVPLYTAPPAPAVPDGWRLVPIRATDDMTKAVRYDEDAFGGKSAWPSDLRRDMVRAAPEVKS